MALALTREFGETFACLNMANAQCPGGGYVEGCIAQEENMFRRSDCHFSIDQSEMDTKRGSYVPGMQALLNAADGRVYLDVQRPRVCIRGAEDPSLWGMLSRAFDDITTAGPMAKAKAETSNAECKVRVRVGVRIRVS